MNSHRAEYESLPATDLFRACIDGDLAAGEEFVRRYDATIQLAVLRTVRRWRCGESLDDAVQNVYARFLEKPETIFGPFEMRGAESDEAYVWVVSRRAAIDYCRGLRKRARFFSGYPVDLHEKETADSEALPLLRIELGEAERYLWRTLPAAEAARDLRILRLFFLHDFTAAQIAALPSIALTPKGVEAVIHRCRKLLVERFRPELAKKKRMAKRISAARAL